VPTVNATVTKRGSNTTIPVGGELVVHRII